MLERWLSCGSLERNLLCLCAFRPRKRIKSGSVRRWFNCSTIAAESHSQKCTLCVCLRNRNCNGFAQRSENIKIHQRFEKSSAEPLSLHLTTFSRRIICIFLLTMKIKYAPSHRALELSFEMCRRVFFEKILYFHKKNYLIWAVRKAATMSWTAVRILCKYIRFHALASVFNLYSQEQNVLWGGNL